MTNFNFIHSEFLNIKGVVGVKSGSVDETGCYSLVPAMKAWVASQCVFDR